jgi:hypothetical protein
MKAFIIFRDRVTYAKMCFGALWSAGFKVHIVDHDSTWPAALTWLMNLEAIGVPVHRRGRNCWPWELWKWDGFRELMWNDSEPYLVTDPDVVPSSDCPGDWVAKLTDVLARNHAVKAGLGLRLDKIPAHRLEKIEKWESGFWHDVAEPGVFRANIDTTLALYRPYTEYPVFALGPSLRLDHPYVADHLSWYENGDLSPELQYYHARSNPGHHVVRSLKD